MRDGDASKSQGNKPASLLLIPEEITQVETPAPSELPEQDWHSVSETPSDQSKIVLYPRISANECRSRIIPKFGILKDSGKLKSCSKHLVQSQSYGEDSSPVDLAYDLNDLNDSSIPSIPSIPSPMFHDPPLPLPPPLPPLPSILSIPSPAFHDPSSQFLPQSTNSIIENPRRLRE